ncbi:MAG TPA: PilZ domain-containing protein [Candidatus Sulfotelmatobacter sp.]|nr:PilZ domain-containing protein [Candidatus Sulfotelmatobacter sp.]
MVSTMAQETDDGLAYLQALKQSAPLAAGVAPAREPNSGKPEADVPSQSSASPLFFRGAEKRRSPRYKCEGSTEICQEGSELRTWATCTDVSMHGCYVEATATFPVGTNVHIKLQASGLQIQSKGCVRVTYPCLGMGIAFIEMSEEDRSRLRELLRTVSRPSLIMGPSISTTVHMRGAAEPNPLPSDPAAALRALSEFFESRQLLMRDEFLRILRKSQEMGNHPSR